MAIHKRGVDQDHGLAGLSDASRALFREAWARSTVSESSRSDVSGRDSEQVHVPLFLCLVERRPMRQECASIAACEASHATRAKRRRQPWTSGPALAIVKRARKNGRASPRASSTPADG